MYRLHPQTAKLVELITSGAIGEVRMIQSSFGFADAELHARAPALRQRPRRRRHPRCRRLPGLDGAVRSPARRPASRSSIRSRCRAPRISAQAGTDEWAAAVLQFPNGIVAEVSCAVFAQRRTTCCASTAPTGRIEVPDFWFAGGNRDGGLGKIDVIRARRHARDDQRRCKPAISIPSRSTRPARRSAPAGRNSPRPGMSWADTLGNCACSTSGAPASGLEYDIEKPARRTNTLSGRPLGRGGTAIGKALDPGPAEAGVASWRSASRISAPSPSGAILLDAFFEAGGNLFDTGWVYGAGYTEKLLRRVACEPRRARADACSSARAPTRRSAIPT